MTVTAAPEQRRRRTTTRSLLERLTLLGPGLIYLTLLVAVPVALVTSYTLFQRGRFGGIVYEASLDNFSRALDPIYRAVLVDSVVVAGAATLIALVIGYPVAYAIALMSPRWRLVCLVLVVIPFWTNFLIRTYAWIVLLNSQGVVNDGLIGLGLIEDRVGLLYTQGAVIAGLVYAYLPLMVLPIYASVARLDPELNEAAANLGAGRMRAFRDVTLPMTLPGVITGCIFVFVPSLGNFVVPELLGGGKTVLVGNLVRDQFLEARDWPFGATLALVMIVLLVALFAVQSLVARRYAVPMRAGGPPARRPGWLRLPLVVCFLFLYIPILTLVVMSFNASDSPYDFSGFSFEWYGELLGDSELLEALRNTLVVAFGATAIATVLGTLLAIGLARYVRSTALDAYSMAPAILPDLVLAIGMLAMFSAIGFSLGLSTVLLAHAAFGTAFVVAVVRTRLVQLDPSVEEASQDLGAGFVTTLVRVTLPAIAPAVLAGALLTFTLSLDEFVIAFFTNGPTTPTLPIAIYSRVRFGVTPEINALATVLLTASVVVVVFAAWVLRGAAAREQRGAVE